MIPEVNCFVSNLFFICEKRTRFPNRETSDGRLGGRELSADQWSRFPAAVDRFPGFIVRRAPPVGLALVPELLALGQSQFHLDSPVLEVQPRGDQGETLLLGL